MTVIAGTPFDINATGQGPPRAGILDSNNAVALYYDGGSYVANVVQDDETVGADYTFPGFGSTASGKRSVSGLSSTSVLTVRSDGGALVRILSRSSTTLTAPGSDVDLGGGEPLGISSAALTSTAAIAVWNDDNDVSQGKANYVTVSGTTITDESIVEFEAGEIGGDTATCKLTSIKGVVAYIDVDDGNQLKACVLSISGTTISAGSPATIDSGDVCGFPAMAEISSTSCLLTYRNETDGEIKAVVLSGMSGTSVTVNTLKVVDVSDGINVSLAGFSSTQFVVCYVRIVGVGGGRFQELSVTGTTVDTVGTNGSGGGGDFTVAYSATKALNCFDGSTEGVMFTLSTASHLWLSTDGGATYSNIGDGAWGANVVGGVVVVPGTAYQTIYAAVGTNLYKTVNGGTAWTLETAIGYEVDFLDLEKDNATVILKKRDTAGAIRSQLWNGAVLSDISTGNFATGGNTAGGDVV